ncbi:MAG TPA: glycoside hydrolase family 130 protein [Candidatus Cloacimonadota bacterium]|jgi:beta-1,4-mannooligosaccharide/beta-1,4-mannosyl-N-acetylglucosamine phosphorylase|nr:glycoside hydrolase family 130 protein [Candidatus Cloacimonadales bacterium]HPY96200.1 glycoside hydrolase family 130 protein [Candidatus Cloacimonadota bacterium]HQB40806.1 glycoside hydrolase family 130 protein [Candidatus Cloacimonadota bacterium]
MKRYEKNPIISRLNIVSELPELKDVSSVFNPGAVIFENKVVLLLRVQNRGRETLLVKAISADGYNFTVSSKPVIIKGLTESAERKIYHVYDPRITQIQGKFYILCAIDTSQGCFLGLFTTSDFDTLDFIDYVSEPDVRNGVLFPELINGYFYRLERPNQHVLANGTKTGSTIIVSRSIDLIKWEKVSDLFSGRPHYWDELIGSGPPPLKTKNGWLHIYHGVATHFASANIYQAGYSLLDLENPENVLDRGKYNILEPRELYELTGQVPNVVFPSGMVSFDYDNEGFLKDDAKILIYYGAADTVVSVAEFCLKNR